MTQKENFIHQKEQYTMYSSPLLPLPNNTPLTERSCYNIINSSILQKIFSCLKIILMMQCAMSECRKTMFEIRQHIRMSIISFTISICETVSQFKWQFNHSFWWRKGVPGNKNNFFSILQIYKDSQFNNTKNKKF